MSKRQLVDAYVNGKLTRRTFIRRLTKLGVSVAAAVAYSNVLATGASADGLSGVRRALKNAPPQAKKGLFRALKNQKLHALGADFYR
jgi:hypothetical protein